MTDIEILNYLERRAHKEAHAKTIGKRKCNKCDLYFCICQLSLKDWVIITQKQKRNATKNCQVNCININKKCLDCYKYNKYMETKNG